MATFTPYLNLEKPTTSERLDVLKINSNWDKIDAGVSALNGQIETYKGRVRITGNNTTYNIDMTNFGSFSTTQYQGFIILSRYGAWWACHTFSEGVHDGSIAPLYVTSTTEATISMSADGKTMILTFGRTMYGGITVLG